MPALGIRASPERLWALATGFPGFHAVNAGLSIVYTLAQTLVFARVLDHNTFSMTVAVQAAGLYLLPINQSVSRANFIVLRQHVVRGVAHAGLPEIAAAFQFSQIVLLIVPLLIPPLIGARDAQTYASMAALTFFCTYSNIWYCEMQMSMLATGQPMRFERLTLVRRLINFASLAWLFVYRDFFYFNIGLAAQTILFHLLLQASDREVRKLFGWPRGLRWPAARVHLSRLWISLQATFAEWLTLNAPYMIFTLRFGIGPGLVAVDAVMKLLRMVVSVTRNLSEIALPRVSHAVFSGEPERGQWPAAAVLVGGGLAAGMIATAVGFAPQASFDLLLGPNNTVPAAAGAPAALALLSGVGFAAGSHLVGHTGHARSIRRLMWFAAVGIIVFASYVLFTSATIVAALWAFAGVFSVVSLVALAMLARLLTVDSVPTPAVEPR